MSVKYSPEAYASRYFQVDLSPEDIGEEPPTNEEEFKAVLNKLQFKGTWALETFLLKEGVQEPDLSIRKLRVFKEAIQ